VLQVLNSMQVVLSKQILLLQTDRGCKAVFGNLLLATWTTARGQAVTGIVLLAERCASDQRRAQRSEGGPPGEQVTSGASWEKRDALALVFRVGTL
jgi:hypothetical protein